MLREAIANGAGKGVSEGHTSLQAPWPRRAEVRVPQAGRRARVSVSCIHTVIRTVVCARNFHLCTSLPVTRNISEDRVFVPLLLVCPQGSEVGTVFPDMPNSKLSASLVAP